MSLPKFPSDPNSMTREDAVNQIISSIAMEELGLSHILNAEGEKLQYVLGTLEGASGLNPSVDQLLKVNDSVQQTLSSAMQNQMFLQNKMSAALNAPVMQGPTGPMGPTGTTVATAIEPGVPLFPVSGTSGDGSTMNAADGLVFRSTNKSVNIDVSPGSVVIDIEVQKGMDGAPGPAGADGAIGPAGPAGADGPIGPAGPAGEDGAVGPTGPAGADGKDGATGPAGADGAIGPTGPAGADGAIGPTGPAGADGAAGPTGPKGEDGAPGAIPDSVAATINELRNEVNNLNVTANYSTDETETGFKYNGSNIYRRLFVVSVSAGIDEQKDVDLISDAGYVDHIVNAGGDFSTGNGAEKYQISSAMATTTKPIYGYVLVSTDNKLRFRSQSSQNRSGAPVVVWVDYTKV